MIHSYDRSQKEAPFPNFIFDIQLYMFRTDLLPIIRILDNVLAATGICPTSYVGKYQLQ